VTLYSSRLPWRAARIARDLADAIAEDRGGEGLSLTNFRLLAAYRVPDTATGVAVRPRGLRWDVITLED